MKILTKRSYDDLLKQIVNAENRCRDSEKEYSKELKAQDNSITVLSIDNNALSSKNSILMNEKDELEDKVIHLQNKLEVANNKIHELGSRIGGYVKANNRLSTEVSELKQLCNDKKKELEVLASNNKKLTEEKGSLQTAVKELNHNLNIAKAKKKPSEYEKRINYRRGR